MSLRSVALPPEHGGWGFVLEPLALGLAVAPSRAGAALLLFAIGALLGRHPLRLLLNDAIRGSWSPRAGASSAFAALYGSLAALGLVLALHATPHRFWLPLLLASPLALTQLLYDARNRGRRLLPELLGAAAPGCLVAAVVVAGGGSLPQGLLLWLLLGVRAVASVLYVRARLRAARGAGSGRAAALAGHLAALVGVGLLAARGLATWLAALAFAILYGRALLGLRTRPASARSVGLQELGYGVLTVVLLAAGEAFRQ